MSSITLKSPAKLNLFLKVLRKRPDGYHELQTIFERINLFDEIRMTSNKSGKIKITCDHPHVPVGRKNLVYRVAEALKNDFGITEGVDIRIRKRIPVAAGLAGGSSNAATTLLGLNKIWDLKLSQAELVKLGAKIGSDVPFFLYDTSWADGRGRGERIKPLKIRSKFWHVVVVPKLKLYSKDVFGCLNLKLTKKGSNVNIFTLTLDQKSVQAVGQLLHNDLETSILNIQPGLLQLKTRLQRFGFFGVAFSGSGPACYGLAKSEKQAKATMKELRRYYRQVFAVSTL